MTIKTEVTQEDYTAYIRYVARSVSVPGGDRMVWLLITVAIGIGMGYALSLVHISLHFTTLAAMVASGLAGAFMVSVVIATISRRQMGHMRPSDDGFIIGPQQVTLGDDGIRQDSRQHQSLFHWSLVRSVGTTEHHVFIMIDRIGGLIIPKRAFSSDADREQFVSEIQRRSDKIAA